MNQRHGEERAPAEKSSIYVDPNYRRQKRKEAADLKRRFNDLCGEVTVTTLDDLSMARKAGLLRY